MITDNMIDDLGIINQQIKELESSARRIKQELIARGVGKYAGMDFVAEVQHYPRETINPVLVREFGDEDLIKQVTQVNMVDAVVVRRVPV
jgi:SOS response regulatory protein OraA/RecX